MFITAREILIQRGIDPASVPAGSGVYREIAKELRASGFHPLVVSDQGVCIRGWSNTYGKDRLQRQIEMGEAVKAAIEAKRRITSF